MAAIDIDKPGKYRIVLSDALLGRSTKDVYTGVRYNHKPDPSSNSQTSMHLEPSDSDSQNYDLSLSDNSEKYSYHGVRTSGDGQYVLIFDPEKKHFVLHRIDSTFDMNLVSTPWEQSAAALKKDYDQIDLPATTKPTTSSNTKAKSAASKPTKGRNTAATKSEPKPKVEKPKKQKPVVREPTPDADEESDDGLTIEYPDGPSSQQYQYQSTPVFRRDPSEEISDEDEDAEGEDDDDIYPERNQDVEHLELPSPVNNAGGMDLEDDMELDLEAELEQALKETQNDDESSESEEE
ncbi:putative neurogenic locus notch like protein 2 [Coleophoma cylindrospora]|uniref:Putative neurogenic locus notch like protein 2 n=1 Tax=Coleophoma cylindrospora TaxID=1849047 RepID=A0A3D8S1C0_9HELO|nr:putative neurogenic locus notch like protein 2 [Coleophoma cylindrospora]